MSSNRPTSQSQTVDCDCRYHHCVECTIPNFKKIGGAAQKGALTHLRGKTIAAHCPVLIQKPQQFPQAMQADVEKLGAVNYVINPTNPTYFYDLCFENHLQ